MWHLIHSVDLTTIVVSGWDIKPRIWFCENKILTQNCRCSRNGGQGDSPSWQGFTTVGGLRGVVFNQRKAYATEFQFGKSIPTIVIRG